MESVEVKLEHYVYWDEWWVCTFMCPNCKNDNVIYRFNFCPDCGVKLSFSEEAKNKAERR